jgi:hypothetical protein
MLTLKEKHTGLISLPVFGIIARSSAIQAQALFRIGSGGITQFHGKRAIRPIQGLRLLVNGGSVWKRKLMNKNHQYY